MAREKITLSVEKHGAKFRYKRMHKGKVFKSSVFDSDSRANRSEAWGQFVAWRSELPDIPKLASMPMPMPMLETLLAHAELTADSAEAQRLAILKRSIDGPRSFGAAAYSIISTFPDQIIDDRQKTVERLQQASSQGLDAKTIADQFCTRLRNKAEAGRCSFGHADLMRIAIALFVNWYGGSRSLESLNEKTIRDFTAHLESLVATKAIGQTTAHSYQKYFRSFISTLVEEYPDSIPLPKNLRSKQQQIVKLRKEPVTFTIEEIKILLNGAVPRTKLFLLLMLNCGMYQSDIADLHASEIDWENGRIIRPRSKITKAAATMGLSAPFKTCWLLWGETWELVQHFANKEGLAFLAENGNPLLTHKVSTRNDAIRSAYRRLIEKLKRKRKDSSPKLPESWNKTLKQLRKTGANLIEKSAEHGPAYTLYLNHSVAKQHYLVSGEPVPSFDAAITWLGKQFDL